MLMAFNFLTKTVLIFFKFSLVLAGGLILGGLLVQKRIKNILPKRFLTPFLVVFLGIIFYLIYSFFAFKAFHYPARDLGEYTQVVWNLSLGKKPASTIKPTPNYFGIYFQPILILISLFFKYWPDPLFLLTFQALIIGLGGVPIYWLAKDKLKSKLVALAVTASYLLFFGIQNALAFGFYPTSLAASFLAFALYFTEVSTWVFLFPTVILLFLCQENVALYVSTLALYILIFKKEKLGFFLGALASFWYLLMVFFVMPKISGHPYPHFVFEFPWRFFWPPVKLKTMLFLFGSLGFLNFFALDKMFLALPMLIEQFLINRPPHWTIAFHYDIAIAPPLFWAVISALKRWPKWREWLAFSLLGWSIFLTLIFGLPLSRLITSSFYQLGAREYALAKMVTLVPQEASVSATDSLVPHLATREAIFHFISAEEELKREPDFIVLGGGHDAWPLTVDVYEKEAEKLLKSRQYKIIYQNGDKFVFRKIKERR
jgi:uncharacterized membrane protein